MKRLIVLIIILLSIDAFSQSYNCIISEMTSTVKSRQLEEEMNTAIYNYLKSPGNFRRNGNVPLIIPVVFHVINVVSKTELSMTATILLIRNQVNSSLRHY
ncbi:MAG: hypothetical protein DWQ44_06700 [Bacteroidetes bacterium]|nr:MAG: hypothetical protein DWQ33_03175 [Bacteroidota bacterium]REK00986.1 MAG: hypothetical protein DWQ39_10465 [Bacteroidota bacterium]REK34589.1 MAG: hypothetical protein DWQ44_06700 [Bacteroidota bacterium]REK51848.1 MAG: hypothetical protein DWQ48_00300 [Bacteroidota bacterium]